MVHNVPIIPVLARGTAAAAVPMELVGHQRIELGTDPNDGIRRLIATLVERAPRPPPPGSLQIRSVSLIQVGKNPIVWEWTGVSSAAPHAIHEVSIKALKRMGARGIEARPTNPTAIRAANVLSVPTPVGVTAYFWAKIGPPTSFSTSVLSTADRKESKVVVRSMRPETILVGRDRARELAQQFALTMAGLIIEMGGTVVTNVAP